MLKKFFLGLIALFFVLLGSLILLMGYVFNNPDSVFNAFNSVTEKIIQAQDYEEKEEFFLQGIDQITFDSRQVDLNIRTYSGTTLKILLQGQVPRFERGPFILQTTDKSALHIQFQEPMASQWLQMNINGEEVTTKSDAQLRADIYLPQSFKNKVSVETRGGHVELRLPETDLYELDLQSISGKIDNRLKQKPTSEIQPQDVGHIKIQTNTGSILVEPLN